MGIGPKISSRHTYGGPLDSYGSSTYWDRPAEAPNPDPKRFQIIDTLQVGKYTILKVKYDGCTNFEGVKVLVYDVPPIELLKLKGNMDPHFSNQGVAPFARFKPTADGWDAAVKFCNMMIGYEPVVENQDGERLTASHAGCWRENFPKKG